jgi:hypothetical protein
MPDVRTLLRESLHKAHAPGPILCTIPVSKSLEMMMIMMIIMTWCCIHIWASIKGTLPGTAPRTPMTTIFLEPHFLTIDTVALHVPAARPESRQVS